MTNETRYKKALVNILYYQALGKSKEEDANKEEAKQKRKSVWDL